MEPLEQLGELRMRAGGSGNDRDERRGALEPQDDVGGEEPQLLMLVAGGSDLPGARLLGDRGCVVAADRKRSSDG